MGASIHLYQNQLRSGTLNGMPPERSSHKIHFPAPVITQISLVAVLVMAGYLVSAQWQTRPTRVVNPLQPYTSLTETRDALIEEQNRLKSEITKTQASIDERTQTLVKTQKLDSRLVSEGDQAAMEAGLTAVKGRGVVITLDDAPEGDLTEQAIAHAADLRDLISLLRGSGAEAIAINGERVVSTTAIDCIVNTILVNQTRLSNPFVVRAIGDADKLARLADDPQIMQDLHRRVLTDGIVYRVEPQSEISLPAYQGMMPGRSINDQSS